MRASLLAAAALFYALPAIAAPGVVEGGVTMLPRGASWMVVCATRPPYTCKKLNLWGNTRVVLSGTGKPAALALGEYVSVDVKGQLDKTFAMLVKVAPDRVLRSVPSFKPGQSRKIQAVLQHVRGVRSVEINPTLSEVLISFNPGKTSAASIERQAARKGVRLALPG